MVDIIGTLGPKNKNFDVLKKLQVAGMSILRLNGAYETLSFYEDFLKKVKKELPDLKILMDLPGHKIRIQNLRSDAHVYQDDLLKFGFCNESKDICVDYPIHEFLEEGDTFFVDDGKIKFSVERINGKEITAKAKNNGILRNKKGLNFPGKKIEFSFVTERDQELIHFLQTHPVDYVGISFIQSKKQVLFIKNQLETREIWAKIENQEGVDQLGEIIDAADRIMIARGDLAIETGLERICLNQKKILSQTIEKGKKAVVATQFLDSMLSNPFPTRSEVCDITNAILDGASALVLTGETSMGLFGVESVEMVSKIIKEVEQVI